MKTCALSFALIACCAGATDAAPTPAAASAPDHRYIVERSFPKGALDGLDATNAPFGVKWEMSYATEDKTMTYCVYDALSELAVRQAAAANGVPETKVTEVPVTLDSEGADGHAGH